MKKVGLIILDGWGNGKKDQADAIHLANTPVFDRLIRDYPTAELLTHGEHVGLPEGQMGNSEVGHINIGAGRIVYQELVRINRAFRSGEIKSNQSFNEMLSDAKKSGRLHLMGLVSNGGVHSHIQHLMRLIEEAHAVGIPNIYIHAFTDGRDCDPKSGLGFLEEIEAHAKKYGAELVSIVGRYYAMDRDNRWERIKRAYDLLVNNMGKFALSISKSVNYSYEIDITDEFIEPITLDGSGESRIKQGDTVLCFNFRTDRCREITKVLTQQNFPEHGMSTLSLRYYTMTEYDKSFKDVNVIFKKDNLQMTLGEYISVKGLNQIRIAETEKYPHVTFFFSGGREIEFDREKRIMVPSPKVATYDLQPEMSAPIVSAEIINEINSGWADFICLNFANSDMVGHTGVKSAIIKAVETVDGCLGEVVEAGKRNGYSFVIIADHGNADMMMNADGSPNTAHTINPVPIIVVDPDVRSVKNGILADVAPTILKIMGLECPPEITGKALV